jgi:hypothetical protein
MREPQPRSKARDYENATGEKSCERIAQERAAPILRNAKSWAQVHEGLAQVDMRYERKGQRRNALGGRPAAQGLLHRS